MGAVEEASRVVEFLVSNKPGVRALAIATAAMLAISFFWVTALDGTTAARFGWEDGPIESAGALFFLVAGVGFLGASVRSARRRRERTDGGGRRTIVLAVLAVIMLVCCGEEVSWGQRMFSWQTPPFFAKLNAQNEINLHNIQAVHQWNPDGTEKGFFEKLVNMNRLFSVFWLGAFVVLPLAVISSDRVRHLVGRAGVPVPPLWIGGLFLTVYVVYKVFATIYAGSLWAHTLDELKEAGYAAVYAVVAVVALIGDHGESD